MKKNVIFMIVSGALCVAVIATVILVSTMVHGTAAGPSSTLTSYNTNSEAGAAQISVDGKSQTFTTAANYTTIYTSDVTTIQYDAGEGYMISVLRAGSATGTVLNIEAYEPEGFKQYNELIFYKAYYNDPLHQTVTLDVKRVSDSSSSTAVFVNIVDYTTDTAILSGIEGDEPALDALTMSAITAKHWFDENGKLLGQFGYHAANIYDRLLPTRNDMDFWARASGSPYSTQTFQGWYLTSDFSGAAVLEVPENMVGTITFYAKWF